MLVVFLTMGQEWNYSSVLRELPILLTDPHNTMEEKKWFK